jgi:hypothetical protein
MAKRSNMFLVVTCIDDNAILGLPWPRLFV